MLAGLAVALVTASLTTNAVVLVTVGALLAAAQKALCDVTRLGPPGNVVLTFVSSAALFAPQSLGQVPGHLALGLAAGAWAWLVCMAPGLLRPHGPERRATAQALTAAAAYAATRGTGPGHARARTAATAAVLAARQALLSGGARSAAARPALARLLLRAEIALAAPADADPERLRAGPTPCAAPPPCRTTGSRRSRHRTQAKAPPSGCGTGWSRSPPSPPAPPSAAPSPDTPRSPSASAGRTGPWSPPPPSTRPASPSPGAGACSASSGTSPASSSSPPSPRSPTSARPPSSCAVSPSASAREALISRNYWLGSVCVTPMALLITEFTGYQDPGDLVTERIVDTLVGALVGLVAAAAVTNRRAGTRLGHALAAAERARERAARLLAEPHPAPGALEAARRTLAAALVELRATADAASGEWWQRTPPEDRVERAEQAGHRTLAETVRRRGLVLDRRADGPAANDPTSDGPVAHRATADDSTEDLRP
ncbi:hypothetical protein SGLAM104S_00988 [Streptomyces glaucescens]